MSERTSVDAPERRPTIAYVSYSSGEFDARTFRMARSAQDAGYHVIVYTRWYRGLALEEERDGYRIVRVPFEWRLAVPLLRRKARRRLRRIMASGVAPGSRTTAATVAEAEPAPEVATDADRAAEVAPDFDQEAASEAESEADVPPPRVRPLPLRALGRVRRFALRRYRDWRRILGNFPEKPIGWGAALELVTEPADIWHGMWAGSLPGLARLKRRHGGRTIYDSRDIIMQSRDFAGLRQPMKGLLEGLERRWARDADAIITVNDAYADILTRQLRIPRPPIIMNCPARWTPPDPSPDRFRDALGIPPETAIVLYQGGLMTHRGIEQSMDAILEVPDAVLCLLGFGALRDRFAAQAAEAPYLGKVFVLDAVPPEDLLEWTASADVSVMAIQPNTLNHHHTTPQKLFESLAAGVPVVASDLPGMAGIVTATGAGVLCDPTDPASIAGAIREVLGASPEERREHRARALAAAHERYNWEAQVGTLLGLYRDLLER